MKRQKVILSFAVISFTLLNSACSWVTQFVIINRSGEPIEIRLKYAPLSGERYLSKKTLDEKGKIPDGEWQKLAAEEFIDNKIDETVTLKLAANTALAVAKDVTYTGHEYAGNADFFKIKQLNIEGSRGAVHHEGKQTLTQFKKESDSLYTIIYQ